MNYPSILPDPPVRQSPAKLLTLNHRVPIPRPFIPELFYCDQTVFIPQNSNIEIVSSTENTGVRVQVSARSAGSHWVDIQARSLSHCDADARRIKRRLELVYPYGSRCSPGPAPRRSPGSHSIVFFVRPTAILSGLHLNANPLSIPRPFCQPLYQPIIKLSNTWRANAVFSDSAFQPSIDGTGLFLWPEVWERTTQRVENRGVRCKLAPGAIMFSKYLE